MKRAAFFDVDGTLVSCITQNALTRIMLRHKMFNAYQIAYLFAWFFLYRFGLLRGSGHIRKKAYVAFSNHSKSTVDSIFSQTYRELIQNTVRPEFKAIVERHRSSGDHMYVISGSIRNLCEPICAEYGLDRLFATQLEVVDGRYTGSWMGAVLEGQKKVELARSIAEKDNIDLTASFAYADSIGDVPLLELVGNPVAVFPDARLRKVAQRSKWTIIED